jgi:hypothetical protein
VDKIQVTPRRGKAAAAALVLALHLGPLLTLVDCSSPAQEKPKPPSGEPGMPPPMMLVAPTDHGVLSCVSSYIGLGVMAGLDGKVLMVADNGPAAQAGVLEGDLFLNRNSFYPDMLEEGAHFRMELRRNERDFTRLVRVGKVCYS